MSLPSDADASVLRDRVAALAARVEELETEAEADRALYLRIGMGHTDPELKAKPESEVFGALEQQNRDALYELKQTKSQKYQLKQRVDELEKALESAASAEPVTLPRRVHARALAPGRAVLTRGHQRREIAGAGGSPAR